MEKKSNTLKKKKVVHFLLMNGCIIPHTHVHVSVCPGDSFIKKNVQMEFKSFEKRTQRCLSCFEEVRGAGADFFCVWGSNEETQRKQFCVVHEPIPMNLK